MSTEESIRTPVSRRERGERRIEQIIGAAEEVLVERGYERTTTNAIAERAGISPGSLYQFFRNKDEIAEALAGRYSEVFARSEEHTSELQSLMRISYAVFCLKKKKTNRNPQNTMKHQHVTSKKLTSTN